MTDGRFFELSANWSAAGSDVAEISLRLGDRVLSRIADTEKKALRDYFRASATGLALWFVDNWWRLRWETINGSHSVSADWRLRHELNSAMGGALWPPVMIYSSADRIVFAPSLGKRSAGGPQQYVDINGVGMVMADEYEKELDAFLQVVIEHCARSVDGKALEALFGQVLAERRDPELAGWRRLEACLGYDADEAPDEVVTALIDFEGLAGEEGVEEAARAKPGADSATILGKAIEATRQSDVKVDLSLATAIEKDPELPSTAAPWRFAESAAANLRAMIGARPGQLLSGNLADILGARWADLKNATATARQLPYGVRMSDDSDRARLSLQTLRPKDRRYELARIFGDAVWKNGVEFGVVSRSNTDRQKFQRAFARSLLCPFDDLRHELDVNNPTPESIEAAAETFFVHESVVRNQLVYKGFLPFENATEEAEAA